MSGVYAGIDIGSSKVCTILGELDRNNELQILGVGTAECKGLKKGIIVDIDNAVEAIKSSVEQAERMADMEVKAAYINIAGGQATLIKNTGVIGVSRENREINPDDVERVLQAARVVNIPIEKEIIGVIPIQFIVDGYEHIKDPVGMIGTRLEVEAYIIAAPTASVQNLVRSVEKCDIDVLGIVLDPLGAAEVLLTKDERELGAAIVDVGSEVTDISIFKGASLVYTKMIPVGGYHITNDVSVGLKIPFSEAEVLKRQYGCASVSMLNSVENITINSVGGSRLRTITNRELVDIIEARVQEIYELIDKELQVSGYKGEIAGGVIITGGGLSFIKGSIDLAASMLELPVRIGAPSYIGVASPIYSTGTGIVKYILSSKKSSIINKYADSDESVNTQKQKKQAPEKIVDKIKEFFTDFF